MSSLETWRDERLETRHYFDSNAIRRVVARLHLDVDPRLNLLDELRARCRADPGVFLDVIDVQLRDCVIEDAAKMAVLLQEGGSAYVVGRRPEGGFELQMRVDPTARDAAEMVTADDRAGQHLARAWSAAYGRHGDPALAYSEAVKAVESVVCPVVIPKDRAGTLGKAISALRQGRQNFEVRLDAGLSPFDQVESVVGMLELLWKGQNRHGSDDETVPIDVSSEEAAAAVHLAVVLVQWFRSGVVRRKPV